MQTLPLESMRDKQEQHLSDAVKRERPRLWNFIRRRIPNREDAEDLLQEVFYELVQAYQIGPLEQAGAWMFRVARNRIADWFRQKRPPAMGDAVVAGEEGDRLSLVDILPSPEAGPEAAYAHSVLVEELLDALEELPDSQRRVFIAHEIDGRSFKEIAAETGENVSTLLARKRYAVLHLRRQLQATYDEFRRG
jgi:RNA polymerase sigma factor (sigma-70 family)